MEAIDWKDWEFPSVYEITLLLAQARGETE
ncbi:hypothetical protein SAMN04489735_100779 [Aneurinibacillus thermoaerophilus]|jgi:hypothetical protein|uniref:Uncharacterized protein n=1 Tax=Aneurinibacillus thermoaerophilus TaxID=143495 RepID=A0A1G7YN82_ANETH|nr:hypothetical protein SAMN04489735_100779 [Aneurinibacillus thermoaerophilus]